MPKENLDRIVRLKTPVDVKNLLRKTPAGAFAQRLSREPTNPDLRIDMLREFLEDKREGALGLTYSQAMERLGFDHEVIREIRENALRAISNITGETADLTATPMVLLSLNPEEFVRKAKSIRSNIEIYPHWYRDYGHLLTAMSVFQNRLGLTQKLHNLLTTIAVNSFAMTSPNSGVKPNTHATMGALQIIQNVIEKHLPQKMLKPEGGIRQEYLVGGHKHQELIDAIAKIDFEKAVKETFAEKFDVKPEEVANMVGETPTQHPTALRDVFLTTNYPEPQLVSANEGILFLKKYAEAVGDAVNQGKIKSSDVSVDLLVDAIKKTIYDAYSPDANKTFSYMHNLAKSVKIFGDNGLPINLAEALGTNVTLTRDTWETALSSNWLRHFFIDADLLDLNAINSVAIQAGVWVKQNGTTIEVVPIEEIWNDPQQAEEIRRMYNLEREQANLTKKSASEIVFKTIGGNKQFKVVRTTKEPKNAQRIIANSWKKTLNQLMEIRRWVRANDEGGVDIHNTWLSSESERKAINKLQEAGGVTEENGWYKITADALEKYGKQYAEEFSTIGAKLKESYAKAGKDATPALLETYTMQTEAVRNAVKNLVGSLGQPEKHRLPLQSAQQTTRLSGRLRQMFTRQSVSNILAEAEPFAGKKTQPQEIQACVWGAGRKLSQAYFGNKGIGS